MTRRELTPNGRKSFYGKCYTLTDGETETLYSYETPIIRREGDALVRLWPADPADFTATTGRHIAAFCGLNKREFLALPLGK